MKICMYSVIYVHGDICVLCNIFTWAVHVSHASCNIFTRIYGCIMLYIHTKIYMKLNMYYVIDLHEDIHVLCKIFAWRDTCIMNYICLKLYMYKLYYILWVIYYVLLKYMVYHISYIACNIDYTWYIYSFMQI